MFSFVFKANPYHDAKGRFTSKEKAQFQAGKVSSLAAGLSEAFSTSDALGGNFDAYPESVAGKKAISDIVNMYWKYHQNTKASGGTPSDLKSFLIQHMSPSHANLTLSKAQGALNAKKAWIKIYQKKAIEALESEYPDLAQAVADASPATKDKAALKLKKKLDAWKEQYITNDGDPEVFNNALKKAMFKASGNIAAVQTASGEKEDSSLKWLEPQAGSLENAKMQNSALGINYYLLRDKYGKDSPQAAQAYEEWQKSKDWIKSKDPSFDIAAASGTQKSKATDLLSNAKVQEKAAAAAKAKAVETAQAQLKSAVYAYEVALANVTGDSDTVDLSYAVSHQSKVVAAKEALKKQGLSDVDIEVLVAESKANAEKTAKAQKELSKLLKDPKASVAYYEENADSFHGYSAMSGMDQSSFSQHHASQYAALSDDEKSALKNYTGAGYKGVNKLTVGTTTATSITASKTSAMASAMSKMTLGRDMKLRRNAAQKWFWQALGIPEDKMNSLTESELESFSGKTYVEKAFSSTSMGLDFDSAFSDTAQKSGAVSFHIRARKEIRAIDISAESNHKHEREVILDQGVAYVIRRIRKNTKSHPYIKYHVDVDAIGHVT